jgi:hypothetical protein
MVERCQWRKVADETRMHQLEDVLGTPQVFETVLPRSRSVAPSGSRSTTSAAVADDSST